MPELGAGEGAGVRGWGAGDRGGSGGGAGVRGWEEPKAINSIIKFAAFFQRQNNRTNP